MEVPLISPESLEIVEQVKQIGFTEGQYAIWGSGPLFAYGLKVLGNDLDVIVTEEEWEHIFQMYKNEPGFEYAQNSAGIPYMAFFEGKVEVWKEWGPGEWNIAEVISSAVNIGGVNWVPLETVRKWKRIRSKPKDAYDLELLDKHFGDET